MAGQQIFKAMAAVMKAAGAIGKDTKNQQQGFMYRGIDDVYNAMHNILAENGVFMTPEVIEKTREERTNNKGTVLAFTTLRIKYTFFAEDGSSVSCVVEGEGMDSGDKSSNKAMAIAHKYALLQTFCIPTQEQKDPDAETHEVKGKTHPAVRKLITVEQALSYVQSTKNGAALSQLMNDQRFVGDCKRDLTTDEYDKVQSAINEKFNTFKQAAS